MASHSEVAHHWAHQTGKYTNGSSMFYSGVGIYSYGYHFEAGRIVYNKKGEKAYIINDSTYSNSTSKHQSHIRHAIPHGSIVFYVNKIHHGVTGGMAYITEKLDVACAMAERFTKIKTSERECFYNIKRSIISYMRFWDISPYKQLLRLSAKEWSAGRRWEGKNEKWIQSEVRKEKKMLEILFNPDGPTEDYDKYVVNSYIGEGTYEAYKERNDKHLVSVQKARETIERKREEEWIIRRAEIEERERLSQIPIEEKLPKWKNLEIRYLDAPWDLTGQNTWLRLNGEVIETSKGIKINISEAKKVWGILKHIHATGEILKMGVRDHSGYGWKLNKYKDGLFTFGCHRIPFQEMEEVMEKVSLSENVQPIK